MTDRRRPALRGAVPRLVAVLGALFVLLALARVSLLGASGRSVPRLLVLHAPVALPGIALLYGAAWLSATDLRRDVRPRVVVRTLAGGLVTVVAVGLLAAGSPDGLALPIVTALTAASLGTVAGFAVGVHEARALSRAREAERARQDLERTVAHLETANERLEQFVYAASHDLQEPLRMISTYLRRLEGEHRDDLDAEALEFLEFAVDGADRTRTMIQSLLAYAEVTTGGEPLGPTDAGTVLERVRGELSAELGVPGEAVEAASLPTVRADPEQLRLLFRNLLSNALEHGAPGAGATGRRDAVAGDGGTATRVSVDAEWVDGAWRFAVADDGPGIHPEYHDRIFDLFEQLSTDGGRSAGGVGLALCQRIVERHGGDIWVDSAPGEGTTVYFTIPDARPPPEGEGPG